MARHTILFSLCLALLFTQAVTAQTYTWTGVTSTDFNTASNWSPARTVKSVNDKLIFNLGGEVMVTGIVTETIGGLTITNNTQVELYASIVNKIISIENTSDTDLAIAYGSSLVFKNNGGVRIDLEMGANTESEIGGNIMMEKGTANFNDGIVTLYASTSPFNKVDGSFSFGSDCSVVFGKSGTSQEGQIRFPSDIFANNPTIANLTIDTPLGVRLGNQSFTVTNTATFVQGDLVTNNQGRIIFSPTAANPVEMIDSKIIGFAQMTSRSIGTNGISFLGYSIEPGIDDLGNVNITRMTGTSGIRFSEDYESIAATWDVNVDNQPENGRDINLQWLSAFDNAHDVAIPMQIYRLVSGDSWNVVGGANEIASSVNGLRTSASVLTTHFSEWTLSSTNNVLPVSLIDFSGKSQHGEVSLNWSTATEQNNERFIIERKSGGEFIYIGSVAGKGTSTEVNTYQFTDTQPLSGNNYYRLVQQDLDGKRTAYDPIMVQHAVAADFKVYPNPTSGDNLSVLIKGADEVTTLKLYDAHGALILEKATDGLAQVNVLDGKILARGLYFLELNNGEVSNKQRVIVR